jgi:hypothetical protein
VAGPSQQSCNSTGYEYTTLYLGYTTDLGIGSSSSSPASSSSISSRFLSFCSLTAASVSFAYSSSFYFKCFALSV